MDTNHLMDKVYENHVDAVRSISGSSSGGILFLTSHFSANKLNALRSKIFCLSPRGKWERKSKAVYGWFCKQVIFETPVKAVLGEHSVYRVAYIFREITEEYWHDVIQRTVPHRGAVKYFQQR